MKNRNNRLFWTAVGSLITGETAPEGIESLPDEMRRALHNLPPVPETGITLTGANLEGKRGRYIYSLAWKILREEGFQRPFRARVLDGIELFVPFCRNPVAVIPQGFQARVPVNLRALALVAKSAALRQCGIHLVVCCAVCIPEAMGVLQRGRCSVCTPDRLAQLVNTLDFSH